MHHCFCIVSGVFNFLVTSAHLRKEVHNLLCQQIIRLRRHCQVIMAITFVVDFNCLAFSLCVFF